MANKNIFYDLKPLLSRTKFLNFAVGGRGVGKTFACKKFCVEDWIKHKRQFVYVRRYNTELDLALTGFFEQLQHEGYFEDKVFKVKPIKKHLYGLFMDGEIIGYACALTTSLIMKSASFPDVYNLIFDEVFIPRGSSYHYLKNEVVTFLELLETIFRLRNGRVICLSNAITVANPYYDYFGIIPKSDQNFQIFYKGEVCLEQVQNQAFKEEKVKTAVGKLIAGSRFGDYAIENKNLQDDGCFIAWKPTNAKLVGTMKVKDSIYGLWSYQKTGSLYVSGYYDPNCKNIVALTPSDHDENTYLVRKSGFLFERLKSAFEYGCLYFESESMKKKVLSLIENTLY